MIKVLEFIFQDFWHWLGSVIMIAIICNINLIKVGPVTNKKENNNENY